LIAGHEPAGLTLADSCCQGEKNIGIPGTV
jgi:hypothetical protein